jgi:hypothetical protein
MNEPHENLDHDRFADDARPRPRRTTLRRGGMGSKRAGGRRRCTAKIVRERGVVRARPCSRAARGPLREWL